MGGGPSVTGPVRMNSGSSINSNSGSCPTTGRGEGVRDETRSWGRIQPWTPFISSTSSSSSSVAKQSGSVSLPEALDPTDPLTETGTILEGSTWRTKIKTVRTSPTMCFYFLSLRLKSNSHIKSLISHQSQDQSLFLSP